VTSAERLDSLEVGNDGQIGPVGRNAGASQSEAVGRDRKGLVSLIGYVAAITLAFVSPGLADLIYARVAVMWIVPDRRIAGRITS
jgi:hypothetical protein